MSRMALCPLGFTLIKLQGLRSSGNAYPERGDFPNMLPPPAVSLVQIGHAPGFSKFRTNS